MNRRAAGSVLSVVLLAQSAAIGDADELLLAPENNRLHRIAIASLDTGTPVREVLIENAKSDPVRGLDINGMVCALPDGSGRFVAGEDTGQPERPAGWGVFEADGRPVGKLVASSRAEVPEPYGCAFDAQGRLFTSEIGDPGFFQSNGQLILWYPPFEGFPEPGAPARHCKIATDLGTPGGIAVDRDGRVYVAASSDFAVHRFSPPFPGSADAAGGCGRRDASGAPLADAVTREVFARGLHTFSGLALAPNGNLYVSSVATGEILEYDLEGRFVRMVLDPPEWLPPFATGTPQGLAVDAAGALYYADLDLVWDFPTLGPGPDGKVWRIGFDANGAPRAPEILMRGLRFPDGLGITSAR